MTRSSLGDSISKARWLFRLSAAFLLFSFGCTPKQGYPGPALPESETAFIAFHSDSHNFHANSRTPSGGISLSDTRVDDTSVGSLDWGIRVLPGPHTASFSYRLEWNWCGSEEPGFCPSEFISGSCSVKFEAEAGKSYKIQVQAGRDGAGALVIPSDSYQPIGSASCKAGAGWF